MPEPAAAQGAFGAASRNQIANRGGKERRRAVDPIERTDPLKERTANRLARHRRNRRRGPLANGGARRYDIRAWPFMTARRA